jgi:DNA-binding NarL/FixJ family response regulator
MKPIRVIVADNFPIVRQGLCALLKTQHDMQVIAEAVDGDDALTQTQQLKPDVLIIEVNMPGLPWHQIIKQVKQALPRTSVLVATTHREQHFAIPVLRAGAHGFISKAQPTRSLFDAIRQVAGGNIFISSNLAQHLAMKTVSNRVPGAPHEQLTPREQEIFVKLINGEAASNIAKQLHISPKTVSTHKTRILKKLELDDICALVRYAVDHSLI